MKLCRIPKRITILLGTPCSKKITSKRCWAANRSGYVKSGRSRWPRACSCRTSYGDALAVALTQTCVHFLNNVCAWQIGFTELWIFPVAFFRQIGRFSKISKIPKTAFLEWVAFTLTRAWQGEVLGRIDDLFSSKIEKCKKKNCRSYHGSYGHFFKIVCNHFAPGRIVEHVSM